MPTIMVTGAGGFIGGHVCEALYAGGYAGEYDVIGVDLKYPEFREWHDICDSFRIADLRNEKEVASAISSYKPERIFMFATDFGGMGYIPHHHADILYNNLMINMNTLEIARQEGVKRVLFSSSVCVYPETLLMAEGNAYQLAEDDAYPAEPQDAYGWEKLTIERAMRHYADQYGMEVRIARFMNTYGPYSEWDGGKEKAPAAFCRKVAESKLRGDVPIEVEVWGDGQQIRSFTYIDDLVRGILLLMDGDYDKPVNLGYNDEYATMDEMVKLIYQEALGIEGGVRISDMPGIRVKHVEGQQGARNRRESNALCGELFGWVPSTSLREGLAYLYPWVEEQVRDAQQDTQKTY